MKLLLLAYLGCMLACLLAHATAMLPLCQSGACVQREEVGRDIDRWFSNDYLVNGKWLSVATRADAIRWKCQGVDPTSSSAPHYHRWVPFPATAVDLDDCTISSKSYQELFKDLTLSSDRVKTLTISKRPQNIHWPSMAELEHYQNKYKDNTGKWVAAAATDLPLNFLKNLNLRGFPMTTEQLLSIHDIRTLTLKDTGLTQVMNLSEFSNLHRLELDEPTLENAALLGTAPSLDELVLRAPDAGLGSMPLLRNVTFYDVYMMGSIFGHCRNLEELTIRGGDLDRINERWLAGCRSLTILKLTYLRHLRSVPDDLLSETTNLRLLDLSYNGLQSLPEGLFSNVKKLTLLNLRHNYLMALPRDLLPSPESLKYVCVADNSQALNDQVGKLPGAFRGFYLDSCNNIFK